MVEEVPGTDQENMITDEIVEDMIIDGDAFIDEHAYDIDYEEPLNS